MKKIFTSAMMVALALSASAGEYVVYNNGTLAEGLQATGWWNADFAFDTADPTDSGVKTFSFAPADNGAAASMGLHSVQQTVTGPLHSATLSYSVYVEGTCDLSIRLQGVPANGSKVEQDYKITITSDNNQKWIDETLNVAEKFPNVAKTWEEGGTGGVVFGVVLENASDAKVYFKDIKYTNTDEAWEAPAVVELPKPTTVPVPETPAEDVISIFSDAYTAATTFNIGGWGQSTQAAVVTIDGKNVYELKNFSYLGWELGTHLDISEMKYMHVDYWTPDGTTFEFTPISPGAEKLWKATPVNKEEWNSYNVPLSYFTDANVNLKEIYQIKFDNTKRDNTAGYIANVYFYKDDKEDPVDPVDPVDPTNPATFTGEETGTVKQIIDGTTTEYSYKLTYSIVYNTDKTLTITPVIEWAESKAPVGLEPWMIVNVNGKENKMDAGVTSVTTTDTYNTGDVLAISFFKPYGYGGVFNPTINYTVGTVSGVESIIEDAGEAVYYDLRGVRVANPEHGIFIRVQGNKATKIAR